MALLNYTTSISVERTVAEIQKILVKGGAKRVALEYDEGEVTGIAFQVEIGGVLQSFQLPASIEAAREVLERQKKTNANIAKAGATKAQAARVAWRILKDWTEAQMALIELKQATLPQIMLPYLLVSPDETLYERLKSQNFQLPAPQNAKQLPEARNVR